MNLVRIDRVALGLSKRVDDGQPLDGAGVDWSTLGLSNVIDDRKVLDRTGLDGITLGLGKVVDDRYTVSTGDDVRKPGTGSDGFGCTRER